MVERLTDGAWANTLTLRIFTYLTLVAGEPTVAGTYFDPDMAEVDGDLGNNTIVQTARTGMPLIVSDNQLQLPVAASLSILSTYVDLESETNYLGSRRYIAPVLYVHWLNHVPICIFQQNIIGHAQKALLCYFAPGGFDKALAGQVVTQTHRRTHFARMTPPRVFNFNFVVVKDGEFTDIDDITSASWFERF